MMSVEILIAHRIDLSAIEKLLTYSFGPREGPQIVELVHRLHVDETAGPLLSLIARTGEALVGHVLFSKAQLSLPAREVAAALLAPLAVHPDFQSCGIGNQLIAEGFDHLAEAGVELVFVLGSPVYYGRFGFSAAGPRGLAAPYPLSARYAQAWMVKELLAGALDGARGQLICAQTLRDPRYWRE